MFITKPDSTLSGELAENHGFTLLVPAVYRYEVTDSVHIFRNDNPDPSELIRQFAVTWRPLEPEFDTEDLLEWRAQIVGGYYNYPQVINAERVIEGPETLNGFQAYSYQAVWENPPGTYPGGRPLRGAGGRLSGAGAPVPGRRVALRPRPGQVRVHGAARRNHELVPLYGGVVASRRRRAA